MGADTARRWADAGRVAARRDETGRRLVDGKDLAAFSADLAKAGGGEEDAPSRISVRNALALESSRRPARRRGRPGGDPAGPHRLVSLLTREAVEELGREVGVEATARVKSTDVHIDWA